MSETVRNVCNQVHILSFGTSKKTVNGIDNHFDDVNVFPFVEAADIICLSNFSFVENQVNSPGMVFNEKPVANVLTLAIDREWLAVADIIDKERNQFFRELVWPVIVRAVGNNGRHSVSVMKGADKMVAARLACRVRAMRVILGCLVEEVITVCQ